jgi:hypothetical protein
MTGEWMVENQGNRKAQQGSQGSSNLRRLTSVLLASLFGLLLSVLVAGAQENGSLKERVMHTVDSVMGFFRINN